MFSDIIKKLGMWGTPLGSVVVIWETNFSWLHKWLLCDLVLLISLIFLWSMLRWGLVSVPYQKGTIEEWKASPPKVDPEDLAKNCNAIAVGQRQFSHSLDRVEYYLSKIYGETNWGTKSWRVALKIAWLYPIGLVAVVWVATGRGTLGGTTLIPPLENFLARVSSIKLLLIIQNYRVRH